MQNNINDINSMEEIFKTVLSNTTKIKELRSQLDDLMNNVLHFVNSGYDPIINYILKNIVNNIIADTPVKQENKIYTSGSMVLYDSIFKISNNKIEKLFENELFKSGILAQDDLIISGKFIGHIIYITDKGYSLIKDNDLYESPN